MVIPFSVCWDLRSIRYPGCYPVGTLSLTDLTNKKQSKLHLNPVEMNHHAAARFTHARIVQASLNIAAAHPSHAARAAWLQGRLSAQLKLQNFKPEVECMAEYQSAAFRLPPRFEGAL